MSAAPRKARAPAGPMWGRVLLAVLAAYLMVLAVRLGLAGQMELRYLVPAAGFAALLLVLRAGLALLRFRGDTVLLTVALFLAGLGLVTQLRLGTLDLAAPAKASNYALGLGAAMMLGAVALLGGGRARWLASAGGLCGLAALGVLGLTLAFGHRFRGAVFLAGYVNPTEVVKVLLVVYAAALIDAYRKAFENPVLPGVPAPSWGLAFSFAVFWLLPMALLVVLRDVGLIALLNATLLVMVVLATGRWGYLAAGLLAAAAAGWALLAALPHGTGRVGVWLDPFADPTGRGWQVLQSLSAMYTGGLWGSGLGAGHPLAVPIAASDFVYAALAEEIGYVGCGLVLLVYLLFFYRGFRIADSLRDPFAQSLASGLTTLLATQTLFNIGGVTKALPLTGLTLPFVSHGGSSLVTSFLMLGLLLALSDQGKR